MRYKDYRLVTLALTELNMKWISIKYSMLASGKDEDDAEARATDLIQADLDNIERIAGQRPLFDSNYSNTWGFYALGIYQSMDEMAQTGDIVDPGF